MNLIKQSILYLLLALFSLTPLVWFKDKGNVLINGIDTNFPLDPVMWFTRRLYVWTDFPNAGGDFSSSTAGLFFHLIQVLPGRIGFDIQHVQIISLVFWFSLIIFSAYTLAKIIFKKNIPVQLLFVALYAFNIYIFNTWENVKVANLSLVAAIPFGVSIIISLWERKLSRFKAIFLSSLVGVVLSGAGINPAYFACFILVLVIILLSRVVVDPRTKVLTDAVLDFLIIVVPVLLVNLFWILPTINFVIKNISATGSIFDIGFTNWVDSLSENTSLLNIFRLQGAWDWYAFDGVSGLPLYIPYALNYFYKLPFVIFSFVVPTLAITSLFIVARTNADQTKGFLQEKFTTSLYIAFATMLIVGVFLGAGTYPPTGDYFRWISSHLPFFTIFRSPWYIFTPLVTLSLAGLTCLFFFSLYQIGNKLKFVKFILFPSIVILIAGNFLYVYPLVTGKIFRPGRPDSFFVEFPGYTFETKQWLKTQDKLRVVSYPDDEIEKFNWGYRGIESILGLFSDKEVIFNSLNNPDSNVSVLIKALYKNLKRNEIVSANSIAGKLNVGLIFEKNDQPTLSPSLPVEIKELEIAKFENWSFYKFPQNTIQKIYSPSSVFFGPLEKEGVRAVSAVPTNGVLLNQKDNVVKNIPELKENQGFVLVAKNSQKGELENLVYSVSKLSNRLVSRDLSKVEFSIDIPEDGEYSPVLERYKLEDFGIFVDQGLEVDIDGTKITWNTQDNSDSFLYFNKVNLTRGEHKINIKVRNDNLVNGGDFNSGATFDKGGYGEGKGEYTIREDDSGKFLQIFNVGRANVSADFPVSQFDPYGYYYFELRYKQIYGNNATVVITQGNESNLVKAQVERLPNYPEWNSFSFYYEPVQTRSILKINLESPFTSDPLGTKIIYDDVRAFKVFTNDLLFVKNGDKKFANIPKVEFTKESPVAYKGKVTGADGPHLIVFAENYSADWELVVTNTQDKKNSNNYKHFSANLYSNAWYVDSDLRDYEFKIFYKPQNLFLVGSALSLLTIFLSTIIYLLSRRKIKKL